METPSSTRSHPSFAASRIAERYEDSEKKGGNPRNGHELERSALFDITNDSPIVGLAMGSLETPTPRKRAVEIHSQSKQMSRATPGSGETLLRGQVKNLLQKVEEEEGEHLSKLAANRYSPTQQLTFECKKDEEEEEENESGIDIGVTRSLFLDFSEKLDSYEYMENGDDDDDNGGGSVEELCEGMTKMSVRGGRRAKWSGKHTRFVYDSDGELEGVAEVVADTAAEGGAAEEIYCI
ncbi:hypothetical protein DM860_004802 [Cuscuta australis]|uniref:Uncharacterized protein n=1 Tax=Cuscuta australis TaxID=267555 RepID=A0A328DRB8_9ASTE|nr:hypothetical protein DM860_004802 [Cuscuta australis]